MLHNKFLIKKAVLFEVGFFYYMSLNIIEKESLLKIHSLHF